MKTTPTKLSITQWAEKDRPREKLRDQGAESLSDAELLAIIIGSGTPHESAVELMKRILSNNNNSLSHLGKLRISDLCRYNGIGEAKAISLLAACELGKRRQREKVGERPDLGSATAIYNYMHPIMQDLDVEEAWVLLMNQNYRLIRPFRISHGGLSDTSIDVRIVIREALLCNATTLALVHNHPSNHPQPSHQDDNITRQIKAACDTMRLHFLDHIIIVDGRYYSYCEEGRL